MGYRVVDPASIEPTPDRPCQRLAIGEVAGLESLSVNRYEAEPGEQLPLAYHYHDDQEEVFYVLAGELHAETPDGEYVAGPGECFVVQPGNAHRIYNPEEVGGTLEVLAIGAPAVDDVHAYEP